MKYPKIICVVLPLLMPVGRADAQDFGKIKANLARPGCHWFEFLSVVESEVFDQVDTAEGTAYIASDGRYYIRIADEVYLNDLVYTYSFSEATGQVIMEKSCSSAPPTGEEFSFVLKMDDHYETYPAGKRAYRLLKRDEAPTAYPDSLMVHIDRAGLRLEQLEYFDVNEELTRIIVLDQTYQEACDTLRFVPGFPDSAEVIKL